jgi:putative FmdB family regulatory protein
MPIYEFKCQRCAQVFEKLCSRDDKDKVPPCPDCGCVKTRRQMSIFAGHTSSGSVAGGGGCGGCTKSSCGGCRR